MSPHMPENVNFSLTLRISMTRIWFDVLKCPRSWSFTQIIHPTLPRIWGQIWSEALSFSIILGSESLSFSIILGQRFSHRCTLIDQLVLPRTWCRTTRSCRHKALLSSSGPDSIEKDSRSARRADRSRQRQARLLTLSLPPPYSSPSFYVKFLFKRSYF